MYTSTLTDFYFLQFEKVRQGVTFILYMTIWLKVSGPIFQIEIALFAGFIIILEMSISNYSLIGQTFCCSCLYHTV